VEKLMSVVIPAKNEEITIAKCIQGAINALKSIESWEIILVDSYSTDNTVEIAKQFPIRILRLKKKWFKSPHAGRYIGTINSFGKYIFFLDADMIVAEGWIEAALDALKKEDKLAGVTGIMYNVFPHENLNKEHRINHPVGYVEYLPGPSIYKKNILYRVNHFNPFFKGNGEREVGARISNIGYLQARIEKMVCYHCKKNKSLNETLEKASYFIGVGQFLRSQFDIKNIIEVIFKYKIVFVFLSVFTLISVLVIAAVIFGNPKLILYPILISFVIISLIMVKQRNPKKTMLILNGLFLSSINFIYGFFKNTKTSSEYPVDVEIVK
jgi:glycosyltransferase involved in cell wall biosynthesis